MIHYDLFAGIGGFSLALDEVFHEESIEHIFCEWESFPTAVLRKHWPDGEFWGDITELVAHTNEQRSLGGQSEINSAVDGQPSQPKSPISIVTGGFPCQPFSHAGRRRGTADNRYQWPNMFEIIRNIQPTWVIAENVRGLATWNDGMVLEQVCSDLESEGYDVQPLIIPAVSVGAQHRRDRVWIIANARRELGQSGYKRELRPPVERPERTKHQYGDWSRDWQEVAFKTCDDSVDDGIPRIVDGVPTSYAKWREQSLKAYGNAIVPQVAMQIFKAIKETYA